MDHLFKIFEVIMNLTTQKSHDLSKQVLRHTKSIVLYVIIAIGAMVLFCVGVSMALINLAQQLDKPIWVGSALALLSLGVFIYCFKQKPWVEEKSSADNVKASSPGPIEEALALLIKDIVEERQSSRVATQSREDQII